MSRSRRRLTCVKVGDVLGLLPDKEAPQDYPDCRFNQNSTLDLPDELIVSEIEIREGAIVLGFEGTFKMLDWRRFYAIYRPVRRSSVADRPASTDLTTDRPTAD
jgi:hypothetical protein